MSKAEFARAAGISAGTLADLESGRRGASPTMMRRLADALDVPVTTLLV